MLKMTEMNLQNQRVMIRVDFNVPIEAGVITSDQRLKAALPTINYASAQQAAVILISHLGRPVEGEYAAEFSLKPVALALSDLLKKPVRFLEHWIDGININPGEIVLCENTRFLNGENKNDPMLSKKMAALCDIFVMDAFATAHRAQASTQGVAQYAKIAGAGLLLTAEIEALQQAMLHPKKPVVAVVGGAKVSGKLDLLSALLEKTDQLIVGGGIANTFLAAAGFNVGDSLYEPNLINEAKRLLAFDRIPLPIDVIVATEISDTASTSIKKINEVLAHEKILDIGPQTANHYCEILQQAGTIIWNGPVGLFEKKPFASGTETIAKAIANSKAFSLAGGGDTIAAIDQFHLANSISYISTGGGAFLEFIEGKILPGIAVLN